MSVLVVGPGGVGGYFGARLAQGGEEVVLAGRGAHGEALRKAGAVVVREPDGSEWKAPVRGVRSPSEAPPGVDLALLCVKARDHEAALADLAPVVDREGKGLVLLNLQNGIDLHERLLARFGPPVVWGIARIGSGVASPGVIDHMGEGHLIIGEPAGGASPRTAAIAARFERSGVRCRVSGSIRVDLWRKLLWNAAFNSMGGVTNLDVGECLARPALRSLLRDVMREVQAVARAEGVELPGDAIDAALTFSEGIPGVRTSMQQDRRRGVPMEYEILSGAVARRGEAHGVPTPLNQALTRLLEGLSQPPPPRA